MISFRPHLLYPGRRYVGTSDDVIERVFTKQRKFVEHYSTGGSSMRGYRQHIACVAVLAIMGESSVAQQSSPPTHTVPVPQPGLSASPNQPLQSKPEQASSFDLASFENSVRPSVIWVTVFDSSGKLLRTRTGFFISADGRLVTTADAVQNGINAVAKTADGGIYNVSGILAVSKALDLAILKADVKQVPFLRLNPTANMSIGARVAVVGSGLAGSEGAPREATTSTEDADRLEISAAVSAGLVGSPVVDATGGGIGIIVSPGEKAAVRPASSIEKLLSQVGSNAVAKWPGTAETRPSPKRTSKPRLVYAPEPSFPPEVSGRGVSGSGQFRLSFDAKGKVTNVQMIQSTGNQFLDGAAINTFRQWKSAPGQEGVVTVPVTFQVR
jgi:TonB family protein